MTPIATKQEMTSGPSPLPPLYSVPGPQTMGCDVTHSQAESSHLSERNLEIPPQEYLEVCLLRDPRACQVDSLY